MMEDFEKDINQHFKQRHIQPSVNAWEKMEQLLNADKPVQKKPKTIYYLLSAAASVVLFVGLWAFFQETNQPVFPKPENKSNEVFVVNEPKDVPLNQTPNQEKAEDKKTIVSTQSFSKKTIVNKSSKVTAEIIQNNKNQPKESEIGELLPSHHLIQKPNKETEEKILASQTDTEIMVNPKRLLRSAEMERQTDNMISNGQNFWKKIKEINTVVAHSK